MDLRAIILETVPKDLWFDLEDRHRAEAFSAHQVVSINLPLNAKRSREAEGQIRFRLQEQGFEEVVQLHGGHLIEDGIMPGTDLKVYQPFARFQGPNLGVILGFAAMAEPKKVPAKNMSRAAGVRLNIQPGLFETTTSPRPSDIFVLFLTARDRNRAGMIEEIAVGVIGSDYKGFIFYETLEDFLSGYGSQSMTPTPPDGDGGGATVSLRTVRKRFIPPEQEPDTETGNGTSD